MDLFTVTRRSTPQMQNLTSDKQSTKTSEEESATALKQNTTCHTGKAQGVDRALALSTKDHDQQFARMLEVSEQTGLCPYSQHCLRTERNPPLI